MQQYFETTPIAVQFYSQSQLNELLNYFGRYGELYAIGGVVTFYKRPYTDKHGTKRISYVRLLPMPQPTPAPYVVIDFTDFLFLISENTSFYNQLLADDNESLAA